MPMSLASSRNKQYANTKVVDDAPTTATFALRERTLASGVKSNVAAGVLCVQSIATAAHANAATASAKKANRVIRIARWET